MRALAAGLFAAMVAVETANAAPLTPADIAKLCADAEDQAHCGRLIETQQIARLPGLAVRDGDELRVALYPSGTATFRDAVRITGAQTYALWDALSPINAVVLFTTDGDRSGYLLVTRNNGRQYRLPAVPSLSPDRQYIATADFCAADCDNEVALWRVTRDDVRKERVLRPDAAWRDASVEWNADGAIVIDYQRAASDERERMPVSLADPRWRPAR
jgi:hypothetical protein